MTKTWPGKPGVPINADRDGWHWVETPDGERVPYEWRSAGECERGRWPSYWVSQGEDCWEAPACKYLGPALTPDEVQNLRDDLASAERERAHQQSRAAALQKRVAELEGVLRPFANVGEFIAKHHPDPETDQNHETATLVFRAAHTALTGGKDE